MEGPMVSSSTGAMNAVLHKLTNLIQEDHSLRQELVRMNQLLDKFATLLHKFSTGEVSDAQVKEWMRQAREIAYDIEDWVDLPIHPPRRNLKRKLDPDAYDIDDRININININIHQGGLGDAPEPEIAEQIQDFIDRIVGAIERCEAYDLRSKAPNADAADIADPSSCTDIGTHPQLLYESKAPLVAIRGMIDDLVDDLKVDGQEKLKVVSIVGNRGLGKTTIAKEVYQTLKRGFQCEAFVSAGPNQPIRRILDDIYSQVRPGFCEMLAEQQLVNDLRKYLSNKRYFVVIDGIESTRVWKSIKCALPGNDCGSKIVAITRNSAVGKSCSSHPNDCMREINVLTETDSKSLFLRLIFGSEERSPSGLRQAFDGIFKICCGMPLAIIVVAGLFSVKSSLLLAQPEILEKCISSAVNQFPTLHGMRKILHISYADLPLAVKSCFLYLSVFPENYTVKRDRLIRRWIAEGFIPNRGEGRSWETGEVYFDELVRRRLIQPVFDYDDEPMTGCTVHGEIRDFLLCLSSEENFATWDEDIRCMPRDVIRRFSLDCSNQEEDDTLASTTVHISKVRSLTFFGDVKGMPDETLHCLRFLRVLDLEDTENLGNRHLEGIGQLVLLRYLGLGGTSIEVLPEEIGELQNLETLDLRRTTRLWTLPASIVELRKLVSLLGERVQLPSGIGNMQDLEELSTIDAARSLDSVAELLIKSKRLRMLGVRWSRVRDRAATETYRRSVRSFLKEVGKSNLQSLLLEGYRENVLLDILLDSWVPLHHLRRFELTISDPFERVPPKMASLVNLTHLRISIDEVEAEGLRVLGDLPNLILLKLESRLHAERRLITSRHGFRSLVVFSYTCLDGMVLQFTQGAMPQLRRLRIEFSATATKYRYGDFDFGIQHLSCLTRVSCHCRDEEESEVEAAITEQVSTNPNSPVLELNREIIVSGRMARQEEHETVQESYEQESRISDKDSDEEHATLQKQQEIMELDVDSNTDKQADSRVSMLLSESSSHLVNPVGRKPAGMLESDPLSRSSVAASSMKDGSDDSSPTRKPEARRLFPIKPVDLDLDVKRDLGFLAYKGLSATRTESTPPSSPTKHEAISNQPSTPKINLQSVQESYEIRNKAPEKSLEQESGISDKDSDEEHATLQKQHETMEVDVDSNTNKQAFSRVSTSLSESSSYLVNPAGRKPAGMVESDPLSRSSVAASSKKDGSDDSSTTARDLPFELLEKITGGFSKEHEIGSGGYGKVYKGVLNGKEIAVKKLHDHLALDDVQFKNELENLMRVRHQNIVELVGYCYGTRHRYVEHNGKHVFAEMVDRVLCFEYLQNGSLDNHLYDEHCGLDWCTRYKIIKGICEGLNYLHGLEESILHLDLKPANILLDENMVPKIADFGLSRLFGGTHTHITKNLVGTGMYMPPEYVTEGIITKKYDVFSLGVIIIQIMTGREGCSKCWEISPQQFIELVHQNWKVRIETEATSMHTSAGEDCKQVKRCIKIALNCVKNERQKRPTIGDIIHKLRETRQVPMPFSQERGGKQEAAFSKIGPWGVSAGRAHSIKVAPHHLESVTIWSDAIVDSISFSYCDHNGNKHTIGPLGGPGGGVHRIKFAPSEFLLEVSGTIGPSSFAVVDVVQSLTLVTNASRYGPFGRAEGTPFHTSIQSNDRIVGFFGRGGMYVHAIGVYVRHFEREKVQGGKEVIFGQETMQGEIGNEDEEALAKIGPWGGNGGMAYDMMGTPHRLLSLTIFSDVVIDSLAFSYDDLNGKQRTAGPWGGPGGNPSTIQLGRFGFLIGVSGTVGSFGTIPNVITSLTFTTNWGESYGPLGQGGGTPFRIPVENNGRIVGLFGRGGMFVHAIGVYVRHFEREMVQGGKEVIFG